MNAEMIIFAMKEAHRLIDSVAFVASPDDSQIVKSDLLRAIDSIEGLRKSVMEIMVEFAK